MRKFLFTLLFIAIVVLGICANYVNKITQQHTILSIEKIEATEGDSDGFKTRVYFIVSTDKGAYHIKTAGLNAAPQCAGISKDSTYILVTRGINMPIVGVYPCIVDVKETTNGST